MKWPEKPTCHGERPRFSPEGVTWEPAETKQTHSKPYIMSVRTCGYCGSIHPEDLYLALKNDTARLGGSDWKYGWPHKFYVSGIPNPLAGQRVKMGSRSGPREHLESDAMVDQGPVYEVRRVEIEYHDGVEYERREMRPYFQADMLGTASPDVPAKWYNEHLQDAGYDDEALKALIDLIGLHSRIQFSLEGGKLHYIAPYHGFQC